MLYWLISFRFWTFSDQKTHAILLTEGLKIYLWNLFFISKYKITKVLFFFALISISLVGLCFRHSSERFGVYNNIINFEAKQVLVFGDLNFLQIDWTTWTWTGNQKVCHPFWHKLSELALDSTVVFFAPTHNTTWEYSRFSFKKGDYWTAGILWPINKRSGYYYS